MKKKTIALLCAISLMVTGILAGCGNKTEQSKESSSQVASSSSTQKSETPSSSAAAPSSSEQASSAAPVEKDPNMPGVIGNGETLVVGVPQNANVLDYEDNYFTKLLEERLNINIEVMVLPSGNDYKTKVSMMLASGEDVPDVFVGTIGDAAAVYEYGALGFLQPLNEYLDNEEISPNWNNVTDEYKQLMLNVMTAPDGNIYGLAKCGISLWNSVPYRMYINGEWLDKLGLDMPTTTDELYNVLKAFAEKDPNGNGKKDEIPMYGRSASYGMNTVWAVMNAFTFYNNGDQNAGLALDDSGKNVYAPFVTDEWRDGLEFMRKLCDEGLLAASMFTDDVTQFKAMLNAETPVVGFVSSGSLGNWAATDTNVNLQQMRLLPPLTGPEGVCYSPFLQVNPTLQYFVTSQCENPELAYALGEYFWNDYITKTARYGEEGVDWTMDPANTAGHSSPEIDAGYTDELMIYCWKVDDDIWVTPHNKTWANVQTSYYPTVYGAVKRTAYYEENKDTPTNKFTMQFYKDYMGKAPEHILPGSLVYTADEAAVVNEQITNIKSYVASSTAEFITGQRELNDATWKEYLDTLETYGLSNFLSTAQTAYERMTK